MLKECARSLRKGCGDHAAGPDARIDEHPVWSDSRSERIFDVTESVPEIGISGEPAHENNGASRLFCG